MPRFALPVLAAALVMLTGCGGTEPEAAVEVEPPAEAPAEVVEVEPTNKPAPTDKPAAATSAPERGLPGLTHGYIKGLANVEGFECEAYQDGGFGWFCTKERPTALYNFQSFGPDASIVSAVTAGVTMKVGSDPTAAAMPFLPLIASMEFEGAQPEAALAWTQEAAGQDIAETDFGPAHYIVRWNPDFGLATLDIEAKD